MRALRLVFVLVLAVIPVRLLAQCGVPTAYILNPAATGTQNWTDASGNIWVPAGGYPGCTAGDSANAAGIMPITLVVNSAIPNAIVGLTLSSPGGTIDIQSGSLTLGGPGTIASGTTLKTTGGQLVIASGSTLTAQSGSTFQVTSGTASVNGGTLTIDTQLTIANSGGLTLDGATVNGTSSIENSGLVEQNGADSTIAVPLNNLAGATGVTVNAGTLSLTGGGQGDAPFTINAGALDFPSGSYTMGAGGAVSGGGLLSITGGTLSIGGVTEPLDFAMSAGTLTGAGFLSIAGAFTWSGGTITGSGGAELAGTGTGSFDGVNSTMVLDGRTLNIYGMVDFSATTNSLELGNFATLAIYGSFFFTDDGSITCACVNPPTVEISPNGLLAKVGGAGTSVITPPMLNDWDVASFSGTLELAGDGYHTGGFYAGSGATLRFSASETILDTFAFVFGDGTIDFAAGSTGIDGSYSVAGLTSIGDAFVGFSQPADTVDFLMTSGALFLDAPFAMTGTGTWSEGTIFGGSGTFTVEGGATLTIDAATCVPTIASLEFINNGTVNYPPTGISTHHLELDEGIITNNGTWDMQADAPITEFNILVEAAGGCRRSAAVAAARARKPVRSNGLFALPSAINNNGTWKKTGAGDSDVEPSFTNTGTVLAQAGNLHFVGAFAQNSGTTTLGAGDIEVDSPMALNGGTLDGAGTVTGDVNNDATVAPGNGTTGVINITGNYTQGSTGALAIGIAGPSAGQFDQLTVGGIATLDGAFSATLLNAYTPATGTTWQVLTYASHSGAFASETLPPLVSSSSTPTAFVLQAIAPTADLTAGMTGPATVNAATALSYVVTVTNNGPNTSAGTITVNNTLPAGVTGASGSGTGWTCNPPAGGVITCTTNATVGATSSFPTITFNMTAPVSGGSVQNSATVVSSFDPNAANDTASVTTNVVAQADLQIVKSGPNGVTAGQNIVYTIVVTNNGPSSATGVTVSDPTPGGQTFVSNAGDCTTPFPCSLGILAAGQSATITSTFSTSPSFSGNVTNIATVSSSTADPNNTNNSSTKVTNVGAQADLQISKTGPASTNPNQTVTYTISFTNNGPSPATSVVVSDPTPVGIAFVSNSGACTTPFPCSIGTLNAGQSGTITSMYTVPANYAGTSIVNTASISSAVNDPNGADDSSTATTNVALVADVAITKTGPPSAGTGQNIVYTVTVTNNGPSSAGSVVVSDTTPAGLTFVSNSGSCTTPYPCNLGTLTNGQSVTITSTYSVPSNYGNPTVSNTATVTSGASDGNGANNTATAVTVILAQTDLSIAKSGPGTFSPGQNIVYTITVTNNGSIAATNTFVTDPTPGGQTFVSNSGACTTPFPCALGTIAPFASATITSTFNVAAGFAGTSTTNTASVSTSAPEGNLTNNSASTTANVVASAADLAITKTGPIAARLGDVITFTIVVTNNGPGVATNVVVSDPPPSGATWLSNSGACTSAFPCSLGNLGAGQSATITSTYRFMAAGGDVTNTATVASTPADANAANNSASAVVSAGTLPTCPARAPSLIAPAAGAVLNTDSTVTFSWSSVANAIGYFLTIIPSGGAPQIVINTGTTTATVALQPGPYAWFVSAAGIESCRPVASPPSSFTVCAPLPTAPVASVVGETTGGQTFEVQWTRVDGASSYEIQEGLTPSFADPASSIVTENGKSFTKNVVAPTAYWYRVRALSSCDPTPSPFSTPIAVVVVPVPTASNHDPNVNVPNGSHTPVTWQIFVPGLPEGTTSFVATVDRPWLSVSPTSGIIPPAGMNFTISADPTGLSNGTWTGTLIVVYGSTSVNSAITSDGTTTFTAPISISLVTPITPTPLNVATNTAMVVPSVGHLAGIESLWRSDIRLANLASNAQKYQLVFNAGAGGANTSTKTTTISVDGGATIALDDIVRNWYGIGSLGNSSNGLLTVQPLDAAGKPLTGTPTLSAVSSRTFNASSSGTLGQFIPAVPFASFIGRGGAGALASALSLQQIAQTGAYRTNLGIVEGSGKAANVVVTVFDGSGAKLFDLPIALQAGEQKQLNGFLAANGVTSLDNGRIEVRVTGGDGKVTAYASVVDNQSHDPILISGAALESLGANRYVVPGIADFSGGGSNWRSDMRVFNGGTAPQQATLTFYPSANAAPVTLPIAIAAGEIRQLDDVLHSVLGLTNQGGALHVTTTTNAPLVVTARTYDQTSNGTLGQFIPAVTPNDAVGLGDRALQILQAEESPRYRTNIGVVEVTGKASVAEISVHLPDSKVTPVLQIPLAAFESRQIAVLSSLSLGAVYNARISVRVVGGEGRVTAYGSVIDMTTKDPTFIPAQ